MWCIIRARDEKGRVLGEGPQHRVVFAKPFAVSKFEVTFEQWDACVRIGACAQASDSGYGRGDRPVINVSWNDAKQYAAWLSRITGKEYRLLTEAEWEYAARAGTTTIYSWGDDVGKGNADCADCDKQTQAAPAPVGSFKPNAFGLYDGSRTPGTTVTKVRQRTDRRGWNTVMQVGVSYAAVPGSAIRSSSARPAASGTPPASGTSSSVSGWPER